MPTLLGIWLPISPFADGRVSAGIGVWNQASGSTAI